MDLAVARPVSQSSRTGRMWRSHTSMESCVKNEQVISVYETWIRRAEAAQKLSPAEFSTAVLKAIPERSAEALAGLCDQDDWDRMLADIETIRKLLFNYKAEDSGRTDLQSLLFAKMGQVAQLARRNIVLSFVDSTPT